MKFNKYQEEALRTIKKLGEGDLWGHKMDLAHMALGMGSEISELFDAILKNDPVNIGEELVDCAGWYVANYCTLRNYDFNDFDVFSRGSVSDLIYDGKLETLKETLVYSISRLQDIVKKYLVYNREINREEESDILFTIVGAMCVGCRRHAGEEIYVFLERNIAKLRVRFPEKFTEELANNRNLTAERDTLEGKI